jgi:hypothetical protein
MNSRTTNQRRSRHSKLWRRIGGAAGAICLFAGLPANSNAQSIVIGPNVPHDIERKPPSDAYEVELAQFAWQQFVALGWQATYDPKNNNFQRGVPDTAWKGNGVPRFAVWETFAHRSELRPWATSLAGRKFSSVPDYLTQVRATGKLIPDEHVDPTSGKIVKADFTLLDNLDEDSEIGSCSIYLGKLTDPSKQPLIMFQAKVNRDEYEYIQNVFPDQFDPNGSLATAAANNQANAQALRAYFNGPNNQPYFDTCAPPKNVNSNSTITLPCGAFDGPEGTIEVKTAFYKISEEEEKTKFANFFVRNAIYYTEGLKADGTGDGTYTYHNGKFALLGIHIIHKTKNFPDFIFTSFEQKDLAKMGFEYKLLSPLPPTYSNFNPDGATVPPNAGSGTQIGNEIPIVRQSGSNPSSNGHLYPIPAQFGPVNAAAQHQLAALDSIWQNYQLIGVQAHITQSYAASASGMAGPNHFMANFVVESDAFLGNFFGPGFGTNPFPSGTGDGDNIISQGRSYNMGGCKACHAVAQTAFGTDFSFLLDFGANKPVAQPDTLFYVSPNPNIIKARSYLARIRQLPPR